LSLKQFVFIVTLLQPGLNLEGYGRDYITDHYICILELMLLNAAIVAQKLWLKSAQDNTLID